MSVQVDCYCCKHDVPKNFDGMHSKFVPASGITVDIRCPCSSAKFFDTLQSLRGLMLADQSGKGGS